MWEIIKRDTPNIGQLLFTALFAVAVFILVLIHVFGLGAKDFAKLFASDAKQSDTKDKKSADTVDTGDVRGKGKVDGKVKGDVKNSPTINPKLRTDKPPKSKSDSKIVKKAVGNEVRQYSEFVMVDHSSLPLTITTGIRYDNSTNQKIVAQWCYARDSNAKKDGFTASLFIREFNNGKSKDYAPYSVQTLRKFGLTQTQAKNLGTYCRFR